jgi:hypothetical protein
MQQSMPQRVKPAQRQLPMLLQRQQSNSVSLM